MSANDLEKTQKRIGRPKRESQKSFPLTTNVDEETKAVLVHIAKLQSRSLANLINHVLMAYIAEWRKTTQEKAY